MAEERPHRDNAIEALANRRYERAGNQYTRDAWQLLETPKPGHEPFAADEKGWIGRALQSLSIAAVAYRIAGVSERATHRAVEGIAIARDLESVLGRPGQQGCLQEIIADFRVVGAVGEPTTAYDEATAHYERASEEIDSVQALATTPLFQAAAGTIQQVARSTADGEIAVGWDDLHGSDPSQPGAFLASRVRFKRARLPTLLQSVLDAGFLAAPRGTTEYNNEQFRCPACDSTDVNWTGNSTLCLRCSREMERQ